VQINIQLPQKLAAKLKELAHCTGASVESIVIQTLTEQLSEHIQPNSQPTADEFSTRLREWANKFPTLDQTIDDSRDSL
jgi:hypothetical protein